MHFAESGGRDCKTAALSPLRQRVSSNRIVESPSPSFRNLQAPAEPVHPASVLLRRIHFRNFHHGCHRLPIFHSRIKLCFIVRFHCRLDHIWVREFNDDNSYDIALRCHHEAQNDLRRLTLLPHGTREANSNRLFQRGLHIHVGIGDRPRFRSGRVGGARNRRESRRH